MLNGVLFKYCDQHTARIADKPRRIIDGVQEIHLTHSLTLRSPLFTKTSTARCDDAIMFTMLAIDSRTLFAREQVVFQMRETRFVTIAKFRLISLSLAHHL